MVCYGVWKTHPESKIKKSNVNKVRAGCLSVTQNQILFTVGQQFPDVKRFTSFCLTRDRLIRKEKDLTPQPNGSRTDDANVRGLWSVCHGATLSPEAYHILRLYNGTTRAEGNGSLCDALINSHRSSTLQNNENRGKFVFRRARVQT